MSEQVRVSINGQRVTTTRAHAESAGLTIVDEPAVDGLGRALPATREDGRRSKPRTSVDEQAAKKTTARKRAAKKSTSGGSTASTQEGSK